MKKNNNNKEKRRKKGDNLNLKMSNYNCNNNNRVEKEYGKELKYGTCQRQMTIRKNSCKVMLFYMIV